VFHIDFNSNEGENPELVERCAHTALPLLAKESNLAAYVYVGFEFSQRLVSWSRPDEALTVWRSIITHATDHETAALAENSDRLARTFAAAKCYEEAITVATFAVEMARRQARPEIFWQAADSLGTCLERIGRLEEAKQYWFQAIDRGSDVANTFDRLSLALERAADYVTAAHICQTGWNRFSREVRRFKYAEKIQQRGEKCRKKLQQGQPGS
jgi:tetratricopeptide (TPR) repeat protein